MSDRVGNTEDRFSQDAAHLFFTYREKMAPREFLINIRDVYYILGTLDAAVVALLIIRPIWCNVGTIASFFVFSSFSASLTVYICIRHLVMTVE